MKKKYDQEKSESFFSDPPTPRPSDTTLYHFAIFLTCCTILLILAGGLVTSHDAGLAVPDWPLSYGQFFPPMVGNIFWEHGHRMIAGSVGILTLILAVWIQIKEPRIWMKRLGWIALGAVILQAVLGGLTVLYLLPAPISIFHACLAQTFLCILVSITYFLSPFSSQITAQHARDLAKLKRLSLMTTAFIYLQLILGATVRHTSFTTIPHMVVAALVLIHVILVVIRTNQIEHADTAPQNVATSLGILTVLQIFLGVGSFVFTRMIEQGYAPSTEQVIFTAAHQTTGALILASSVVLVLMVSLNPFSWTNKTVSSTTA
jgi:heme a synthase